ncbi:MAG: hypothetical protein AAFO75_00915, partial [Pseudomonadota bacterium]
MTDHQQRRPTSHADHHEQRAIGSPAASAPGPGLARTWLTAACGSLCAIVISTAIHPASAQTPGNQWQTNAQPAAPQAPAANTTIIQRAPPAAPQSQTTSPTATTGKLTLSALLTEDGQRIDRDLIWRVFNAPRSGNETPQLLLTSRSSTPALDLPPGRYLVNAAFGRANLTKSIDIQAGSPFAETFVLNAGGLRLQILVAETPIDENAATYQVFDGERDQSGNRALIMERAKPGLIIRLNAGIYHVVSRYGDANARVRADITVEAGKLTEATLSHAAATVAFKLVDKPGGEALPGTRWTIKTPEGELIKTSVGALPSHILAPGTYVVNARSSEQAYEQSFTVADGQMVN